MKVAVTSQGETPESEVDPRFGRARYFLVFDTETEDCEAHDNSQNLGAAQGAGIQAARNVAGLKVQAVVTGNVGPKAFSTLQAGGIKVYTQAEGSAKDAFQRFKAGELQCVEGPNVAGHWM